MSRAARAGIVVGVLVLLGVVLALLFGDSRAGVAPSRGGACPADHPIKGNFTTSSGEPCIYHLPGGALYERTKAERCFADAAEAGRAGCRASKR